MTRGTRWLVVALALVGGACTKDMKGDDMGMQSASSAMAMDGAQYTLVFKSTWTAASHPFEYPSANPVSGPHYSGIVGAAHNASFALFPDGAMPTPGLERLSEEGKPSPLDAEIQAALAAGTVGALFTSGPLRDLADSIVTTVQVSPSHSLVSFVAMIAPSPDWFVGAANVNLMEGGQWAASRTLQLYAWDSGGDEGTTYKAADRDNNPKQPTTMARTRHFAPNGTPVPVATVTLTRR